MNAFSIITLIVLAIIAVASWATTYYVLSRDRWFPTPRLATLNQTREVVFLFERQGVAVSQYAQALVTLLLEAQIEEGIVANEEELAERSIALANRAVGIYREVYRSLPVNVNRAVHAIVEANRGEARQFPWDPTV